MVSPPISLSAIADARWLSFDVWRDLESDVSVCYDGLILEYSDGDAWLPLGQDSETDPYDNPIPSNLNNPYSGSEAWCGNQDWTQSLIDLNEKSGSIQLRFTVASDQSITNTGAYIDQLSVIECNPTRYVFYFPYAPFLAPEP